MTPLFTGDNEFNDLNCTANCNEDSTEENSIITKENSIQCSPLFENQVIQHFNSILPKNLGVLIQKALNNLKDNDKQKI